MANVVFRPHWAGKRLGTQVYLSAIIPLVSIDEILSALAKSVQMAAGRLCAPVYLSAKTLTVGVDEILSAG